MVAFGDKKWTRPSIMAFSVAQPTLNTTTNLLDADFYYLTDDNRKPLEVSFDRIENRKRMINGKMRTYFIADKRKFNISWDLIPSRSINPLNKDLSFISERYFDKSDVQQNTRYLAGDDMLSWYENSKGQFYMTLVYDKVHSMGSDNTRYDKLTKPSEVVPVFFDDFSYTVVKRGPYNDLWNVTMSLTEA
jgi:hypothetical protein